MEILARELRRASIQESDKIAAPFFRGAAYIVSWFAVARLGGIVQNFIGPKPPKSQTVSEELISTHSDYEKAHSQTSYVYFPSAAPIEVERFY